MQHTTKKPGFKAALSALWGAVIEACLGVQDAVATTRTGIRGVDHYVSQFEASAYADLQLSKLEAEAEYAEALAALVASKPKLSKETA